MFRNVLDQAMFRKNKLKRNREEQHKLKSIFLYEDARKQIIFYYEIKLFFTAQMITNTISMTRKKIKGMLQ